MFSGIAITERLTEEERTCGVCVIDLRSGQVIALLRFETAVQEVFAVTVLPGQRYPELINDDEKLLENSFVVPDAALADVSPALRRPSVNGHAANGVGIVSGRVTGKWRAGGVAGRRGQGGCRPPLAANLRSAYASVR